LTGDPRWNEGGELYRLYDLALNRRPSIENRASESVVADKHNDDDQTEESEEPEQEFSFADCTY
jgi:hypothetical protein